MRRRFGKKQYRKGFGAVLYPRRTGLHERFSPMDGCSMKLLLVTAYACLGALALDGLAQVQPPADCGNGVVNVGEACDDGDANSDTAADACRTDWTSPTCGDGVVDMGEECDDGNTVGADGCQANCLLAICGDAVADVGVQCANCACSDRAPCCPCSVVADPENDSLVRPVACRLVTANFLAAAVLSRLDIDGDGVIDNSPDSDGDGLPDNWELGGVEVELGNEDLVVFYPAPSAIVPAHHRLSWLQPPPSCRPG